MTPTTPHSWRMRTFLLWRLNHFTNECVIFGAERSMSTNAANARFNVGAWEVDPAAGCMRTAGKEVRLEPRLMRVLVVLADARGDIVTKEDLVEKAWDNAAISDDAITSAIYRLRRLLAGEDRPYIETAAKRGYRLVAPVESKKLHDAGRGEATALALQTLCEPSAQGLQEAKLTFERALEADPRDACASAGMAEVLFLMAWTGAAMGGEVMALAHSAALNALGQAQPIAAAYRAAALTFAFHRRDLGAACEQLAAAREFPLDRATLRAEALIRALAGRFPDAIAGLDAALEINPMSLNFGYMKTQVQILARDFSGAVREADRLIGLYPQFSPPWTARGWSLFFLNQNDAAVLAFRDSFSGAGASPQTLQEFDEALDRRGLPGIFAFVYDMLSAPSLGRRPRETDLAFLAAAAGKDTAAIGHLRKALAMCDPILAFAAHLPYLDPLRARAEFQALGLPS